MKKPSVLCLVILLHFFAPSRAGILDTSFNIGTGANGIVEQVLPLPSGKILICGNFTSFNGRNTPYMARLNSNGSVDDTFFAQPSYWVRNMSVQYDGKIVIGGFFKGVQGASRSLIARLNPDGSLDTTFNPGSGATDSLGVAIDGNADPFVFWTAIQPDGKILITGNFRNYNGASSTGIARLNSDGSRDNSFNVGGGLDSWGRHIRVQPNGQIILSGWFQNYNGRGANRLVRINPDGSPDPSFNAYFGDTTSCYSTADAGGGKMIAAGHSLNVQGLFKREIKRLNADGSDDPSWVGFTNEKTESVIMQPDGKAIVVGYFNSVNNEVRTSVARFNADGSLDNTFSANIDNYAWSAALQSDGKLLISGGFYTVDGVARAGVARLLTGVSGGGTPPPPPPPPPPPVVGTATATFISSDTTTHGSWKGVYGGEGYGVLSDATSYPSYVRVTPQNKSDWIWQFSTTDTRALQKVSATDRLAACWYSSGTFTLDLAVTDGQKHRVSLYFLDWDASGRNQTISLVDGDSGAPLNSRSLTGFAGGAYLTWEISGHVKINSTPNNLNAVLSGIFFGPASTTPPPPPPPQTVATPIISPNGGAFSSAQSVTLTSGTSGAEIRYTLNGTEPAATSALYSGPISVSSTATVKAKAFKSGLNASATASATFTITTPGPVTGAQFAFIGADTTTKGNWQGVYGSEGFTVLGNRTVKRPAYAQVTLLGKSDWVWNPTTTDVRALLTPDGASRVAGCYYSPTTFTLDLNLTDGQTHRLAIYFCDWDIAGRTQTVEVLNGNTDAVLHTRTISNFAGGQYLIWDLKGHVKLRFTRQTGPNAILNGYFLSPATRQL